MEITELMKKISFPEDDIACILNAEVVLGIEVEKIARKYFAGEIEYNAAFEKVRALDLKGIHEYTVWMLFSLICAQKTWDRYKKSDLSEEKYIESMYDLKYKLTECRKVHNVCGTFAAQWFGGWFDMTRFAHGRLQYDYKEFEFDDYKKCDITIKKGDMVLECHIPSSGQLTRKSVLDCLKRAYEFNKHKPFVKKNGVLPVMCYSWILYPEYKKVFGKNSNTTQFAEMFDIIKVIEQDEFCDGWRVFGNQWGKDANDLLENISLQRKFKKWILQGGSFGIAYGILLFDGEKSIA